MFQQIEIYTDVFLYVNYRKLYDYFAILFRC